MDTFEQIKNFCEEIDFIKTSLENIHINNIKDISLKDIKIYPKMEVIIDANILFFSLIKNGITIHIILNEDIINLLEK